MTLDEIKQLVQLVLESGIAEIEVTRGENKVRIRRSSPAATPDIVLPAHPVSYAGAPLSHPSAPPSYQPAPPPSALPAEIAPKPEAASAAETRLQYVKSPIVGTFYEAPSPDSPPFVRVGDHVTAGQVLCIIESMKLMNEIEAEFAGTITGKLVDNAKPVEYGEALFSIQPD